MKTKERKKCRELRRKGISVGEISNKVGVSKSSVSLWTRDIILSDSQQIKLNNRVDASKKWSQKNRDKRKIYQDKGRELYRFSNTNKKELLSNGAMLYWAEGHKKNNKNAVRFTNSDLDMIKYFIFFLENGLDVPFSSIKLSINCYDDLKSIEEIETYWEKQTGIKKENFDKTQLNKISIYGKKKRAGESEWGTVKIIVHSTEIIQKIYGIIQEVGCFNREDWLG